jgi:hypothetical protein
MYRKIFLHALLASVLSAIAGIIYYRIYFWATQADFSRVLNFASIAGLSIIICMIASFMYYALKKWFKKAGEIIFNFLFSMISFACVMYPISLSLPLDVKFPELFPGLAVPMVFFPALAWFTVKPLFNNQGSK